MHYSTGWQVNSDASAGEDRIPSQVQAWARDSSTGEPVYIMELGPQRRGRKCGCECQSCNLPLTAVNAAKTEYIKRPHFRHPYKAEKSACMFLAARLAALQLLREQGVFELPVRRVSGKVVGLSGTQHEVSIEHPAERLRITSFDFTDQASALITFDDGRQLRFQLIGSASRIDDGQVIPSIFLDLKDAGLAAMSPEELRKRTTLVPEGLCWQSHWKDAELLAQANAAALVKAIDLMDIEAEYQDELVDVEPKFRRETLLHLEVKKILAEAREIRVPEMQCYVSRTADDSYDIEKSVDFPSVTIPLIEVALERRFGRLIPDVTARTAKEHGGVLLIEVTVTNVIAEDRQARIQLNNAPTLEIDLSLVGGTVSRSGLRELVINNLECKRWLCHPQAALCQHELEAAADGELQERNSALQAAQALNRLILQTPVESLAQDYLDAIRRHQACVLAGRIDDFEKISQLLVEISRHAARLTVHGFPEARDQDLFGGRSQIIPRILSIANGGGVGYELDSAMSIMNAIKQAQVQNRKYHTIHLIAFNVYQKEEASSAPDWYRAWVAEIKRSIEAGEKMYARPRRYDRLLSLLFPEMSTSLGKHFGTENYVPTPKVEPPRLIPRRNVPVASNSIFWPWDQSLTRGSDWLEGRELEQ
jgi:hypothetical protein